MSSAMRCVAMRYDALPWVWLGWDGGGDGGGDGDGDGDGGGDGDGDGDGDGEALT